MDGYEFTTHRMRLYTQIDITDKESVGFLDRETRGRQRNKGEE